MIMFSRCGFNLMKTNLSFRNEMLFSTKSNIHTVYRQHHVETSLVPRRFVSMRRNTWSTLLCMLGFFPEIWENWILIIIFHVTMMQLATPFHMLWRKRCICAHGASLTQCHKLLFASVLCLSNSVIPSSQCSS